MKKTLSLFVAFLFIAFVFCRTALGVQSQPRIVDSLLAVLNHSGEDTTALNTLARLCRELSIAGDYKSSKEYAVRTLQLSEKLLEQHKTENTDYTVAIKKDKAEALNKIGRFIFTSLGNDSEAIGYYRQALKIAAETGEKNAASTGRMGEQETPSLFPATISPLLFQTVGETCNGLAEIYLYRGRYAEAMQYCLHSLKIEEGIGNKTNIATTRNWMAVIYEAQGNYPEALKNVLTALKIAEQAGDKVNIADCYGIMGNIYDAQGGYGEALKSYSQALKMEQALGVKKGIANAFQSIGFDYSKTGNYPEALKNTFAALKIFEEIGIRSNVAGCYDDIGMTYYKEGNYAEALKKHFEALGIYMETGNKIYIAGSYTNIANAYIGLKNYTEALGYLNKAYASAAEINSTESLREIYAAYSEVYKKMDDYPNAFKYHTLYSDMKDSLLNEKINMQMAEMRTIYETEKKDNEIALLNTQNLVKEEEVKKQKLIKYGAFSLIALIVLTAGVFINNMRIRYRASQIIQRNEVRQKISRDLHDEIGSGLTSISMICERAKINLTTEYKVLGAKKEPAVAGDTPPLLSTQYAVLNTLDKIRIQSRGVSEKLREVVWATNPDNDNVEALLSWTRNYVSKFLENSSMDYSLDLPDEVPDVNLKPEVSRNLIFVLKEALNNSVKHSQAGKIEILFKVNVESRNKEYNFSITDNGKGVNYDNMPAQHNGLTNMRKRIEEINGRFEIKSNLSGGTTIEINGVLS